MSKRRGPYGTVRYKKDDPELVTDPVNADKCTTLSNNFECSEDYSAVTVSGETAFEHNQTAEPVSQHENESVSDGDDGQSSKDMTEDYSDFEDYECVDMQTILKETPSPTFPCSQFHESKPDRNSMPIYDGAKINLGVAMLLLATFSTTFNLTHEAFDTLLALLAVILPDSSVIPSSRSLFKRFFSEHSNVVCHYFCSFCLQSINETDTVCGNHLCKKSLLEDGCRSYFVELSLLDQLKQLFARDGFYNQLQHRFNSPKVSSGVIRDIYDGELYKHLSSRGILGTPDSISFVLNTDGACLFKSSKVSVWPIFLMINELPFEARRLSENLLMPGLWFGTSKPLMSMFLKPLAMSLKQLSDGIKIPCKDVGEIVLKGSLLACSCDLPARAILTNQVQFSGFYSCCKCLQPGHSSQKAGSRGRVHVFPYDVKNPTGPLRTDERMREFANQGTPEKPVFGLKGLGWLHVMPGFNLVHGVAIDYMHGVLLGVMKTLLKLWFLPKHSSHVFSVSSKVFIADRKLLSIKPPIEISRTPRAISEHLAYWKASEFRSFLLLYGLPVMFGILSDAYFCHFTLFVRAIFVLLRKEIKYTDLSLASTLLHKFCEQFADLYGVEYCTLNVHQLLHIPDDVRYLGPLYMYSLFLFEDKNGFLMKQVRGTQFIDKQIVSAVNFCHEYPALWTQWADVNVAAKKLLVRMKTKNSVKKQRQLFDGVFVLGKTYKRKFNAEELDAVCDALGEALFDFEVDTFNRILIRRTTVYGNCYSRMAARNNSCVKIVTDVGDIKFAEDERQSYVVELPNDIEGD